MKRASFSSFFDRKIIYPANKSLLFFTFKRLKNKSLKIKKKLTNFKNVFYIELLRKINFVIVKYSVDRLIKKLQKKSEKF